MKRLMAAVYTILACAFNCNAQKHYIGTDIVSGICFGRIHIKIAHGFSQNWSAAADIGIDLSLIKKGYGETWNEHLQDLDRSNDLTSESPDVRKRYQDICVHLDYWPLSAFKGPFISLGAIIKDREGPDAVIGAGYAISITRNIRAEVMYRCCIMETQAKGKLPADGIKAGIYYVF